jgi:hypothetical protein
MAMQRFVTCPHCETGFRIQYLVRPHLVDAVYSVNCPDCHKEIPNPRLPGDPPRTFTVCMVIPGSARPVWLAALQRSGRLLVHGFWSLVVVRNPEWPLCLVLLGVLGLFHLVGWKPSGMAGACAFVALPFLVLAATGIQKVRNRVSQNSRGLVRTSYEVMGLLCAMTLLLVVVLAAVGV